MQNPALSRCQRFQSLNIDFDSKGFRALRNISLDAIDHGIDQRLVARGFGQEVDGARLQTSRL